MEGPWRGVGSGELWDAMPWLLPALLRAQSGKGMLRGQAAGAKEGWVRVVSPVMHRMQK